jgi:hypothetical protein
MGISIGTIITQISAPTGRLTRAISSSPNALTGAGNHWPNAAPATMHRATQAVRQRSKKSMLAAGLAADAAMFIRPLR